MSRSNRLAVVICTFNRSGLLIKALESLYADGYDGDEAIDILVIANNCTDDTIECIAAFKATHPQDRLRLRWLDEPRAGKSFALNTAIERTDNEVLCFVDDDQAVEQGFLQHLLDGIDAHPDADIFCGRLWPAWDGSEPSWVHAKKPYKIPIRPFPQFDLGQDSISVDPHGRYPGGGNISVRRRVFEAIGNFSTILGPTGHNLVGGEDHDFLRRAFAGGHTVRYLPGLRQLHAIDATRMSTRYTLKKSYLRSRANFLIHADDKRPRFYMFHKIASHFVNAMISFDSERRFFYLVRLAASAGELAGALNRGAVGAPRSTRYAVPLDRGQIRVAMLTVVTVVCGLVACVASRGNVWAGLLPALGIAAVGTSILVAKSIADFSQTGPQIRDDILAQFRRYTLFALARLGAWAFALMLFLGAGGVLCYWAINVAVGTSWSVWFALVAASASILIGFALQFIRALRFNPGLLVVSLHYRVSRLYALWQWSTPARIVSIRIGVIIGALFIVSAASWRLVEQQRFAEVLALWTATIAYFGTLLLVAWSPEATTNQRRAGPAVRPPNILMIGSDTFRADRLGAMGYRRSVTPNIDRLAARSTLFKNCYVPCARTAPSLISLLTGTWPHTHGVRDNFVADSESKFDVPALPALLERQGYLTAAISDWCGSDLGKFPFGFSWLDLPKDQWNLKYFIRQGPKDLRLFVSLFTHNNLGRWLLPELYYLGGVPLTTDIGRRARRLLSRLGADAQPFFLNVFYSTTHPPFASEWPWYTRFADPGYVGESKFAMARLTDPFEIIRRQSAPEDEFDLEQIIDLYDGCVAQFDDEVGRMLALLEGSGLADNTIVVVYSDHGMEFFEHGAWGQGNSAVGDFSARIPLVIHDPRLPTPAAVVEVVRSIDLAPTLLELVGLTPGTTMEGTSLAPGMRNEAPFPNLDAYNETGIWIANIPGLPDQHLRYPDLLELLEVPDRENGALAIKSRYREVILNAKDRMIRRGPWKLVWQPLSDGHRTMLFNVVEDPQCVVDRSAENPRIHDELSRALRIWIEAERKVRD